MHTHTHNSITAAIASGTARPDIVFNDWDVNTVIAGFAREVIEAAEDNITDTRQLCAVLGIVAELMAIAPEVFFKDETKRQQISSETRQTVSTPAPELEALPEDTIAKAAEAIIKAGALKYKAAGLALIRAFHLEAADVLELAGEE